MEKIYKYIDIISRKMYEKNRKRAKNIMQNRIRRIKVVLTIAVLCFSKVFAIESTNLNYGKYNILCSKDSNIYITYCNRPQLNYEYYYLKDNNEFAAYCLNLGMKGAEEDVNGYSVNAESKVDDCVLNNIILNCYPYKSISELGVDTKSQAKFASQFAIWTYLNKLDINQIKETKQEYKCVVDAIKKIYNNGINLESNDVILDFNESDEYTKKIDSKLYYVKDYTLKNASNILEYEIFSLDNNVILENNNDSFKVLVPVELGNYNTKINIKVKAKENSVLLGSPDEKSYQNVALTLKDNFEALLCKDISFEDKYKKIEILKLDKDTNKPISNVKFKIFLDNKEAKEYITDENGKIEIELYDDVKEIYITEIEVNSKYILDENTYKINIGDEKEKKIVLYNNLKKGKIKIIKKSKEYNEITSIDENMPLSDVSFKILDENNNVVSDITTNEKGECTSCDLPIGKYYIREYKTKDGYKLLDKDIEVEIKENDDIVLTQILNENVEIVKEMPITGK